MIKVPLFKPDTIKINNVYVQLIDSSFESIFKEYMKQYDGKTLSGNTQNGTVTYLFSNGEKYIGQCENNLANGKGVYKYSSGAQFEGIFKDGDAHGPGKYIDSSGNIFNGMYKKGYKTGKGNYYSSKYKRHYIVTCKDGNYMSINDPKSTKKVVISIDGIEYIQTVYGKNY